MNKKKFIYCCLVFNSTLVLIGAFEINIRFFLTGLLLFIVGLVLLKKTPFRNKIKTFILVFGVWFLLISTLLIISFFLKGFIGVPLFVITSFTIILVYFLIKSQTKLLIIIGIIYLLFISILTYLLPNYYVYQNDDTNVLIGKPIPYLTLFDKNGSLVDLKEEKGKIIVLDFWNTSCSNCIRGFPKFEALKKEFEKDTTICFYTVNIPTRYVVDRNKRAFIFTEKYSFKTLYANKDVSKKLHIEAVPVYMFINKNQTIQYVGSLNMDKAIFYNNFYTLLNKMTK